jgi:diaminopimelate epimerase
MAVTLQKWHVAGNDFLVDVRSEESSWTPSLAAEICDRTRGVGADGLLIATLGDPVGMFLFNSDGSVAQMSGNGILCLAAAVRRSTQGAWNQLAVSTLAGIRHVSLELKGGQGTGSVDMGAARLREPPPATLGVCDIGNPHIVVLDDPSLSHAEREEIALKLSDFVGGANVEFVSLVSRTEISLRTLERGSGWTKACGSGSCAAVAVVNSVGLCDERVLVNNPGGSLSVALDGTDATLTGPVQFVAYMEWFGA